MQAKPKELKSKTGYTVRDYILAAIEAAGSGMKLARIIGRDKQNIYNYKNGAFTPKLSTLMRIEEKTGVSLDEYLPEIRGGMRAAEEMRKASQPVSLRDALTYGIARTYWYEYRRRKRTVEQLEINTLFGLCRMYEKQKALSKPRKPKEAKPANAAVKKEDCPRELSTEERRREMAYGFYRQAMGTGDARDFDFGEAADGSYRFRTAHYDGIIDLRAMELRVIFRRTGRISIRRDLHAGQAMPVPRM